MENVLSHNVPEFVHEIGEPVETGDILITGATGFLGVHVLKYLLDHTMKMIYCLINEDSDTAEQPLQNMLMYYFDGPMWEMFGSRIRCIKGDLMDAASIDALAAYDFKTVINCASCQKEAYKVMEAVNQKGVENLVSFCVKNSRRLVHVSTVGVAGTDGKGKLPAGKVMAENELSFGQVLADKYYETKFKAEEAVIGAIEKDGLDGKVIRVGNMTGRYSDGEYRINFVRNSFMQSLRAYTTLGKVPVSMLDMPVEFSPIDCTAEAVALLTATDSKFTVFHATNGHMVQMGDVIDSLFRVGIAISIVDDPEFEEAYKAAYANKEKRRIVAPVAPEKSKEGFLAGGYIGHSNTFTTKALYRMKFKWPIINEEYMANAFRALKELDFFRGE